MNDDVTLEKISPETCFVPATDQGKGRRIAVAPGNTAARYLHYGRITLEADDAPLSFENREQETGLICLKGKATVASEGQAFKLEQYDALYVPRDSHIEVRAAAPEGCDLAEVGAPVSARYPLKYG